MNTDHLSTSSVSLLIEAYRDAANRHSEASECGDRKAANKSASALGAIYSELRARGTEAQKMLMALLDDQVLGVQLWAASHLLESFPREAESCLKRLSLSDRIVGLNAKMTLKEWEAGRLRFP